MEDQASDPTVAAFRERINAVDRELLVLLNARLEFVRELHEHKQIQGHAMTDRSRESLVLDAIEMQNPGPLSAVELRVFWQGLIDLMIREAARLNAL